jgi:quinoprotein glucose dehydrogenase
VWTFHTIPRPGEPGHDTWGNDSWKDRTGNNVWSFTLTVDEQRGLVYLPVSGPGMNYYGGDRPPAPGLIAIRKDGKTIPALAQVGKSGWMFILNREDGTPVHGINERPQAKADVPGEAYPAYCPASVHPMGQLDGGERRNW